MLFLFVATLSFASTQTDTTSDNNYYRDILSDTWVANDAIGRKMPSFEEVGPVKKDQRRIASIFYITWHTEDCYVNSRNPDSADVSKILKADPSARLNANSPYWAGSSYHWGEPEDGYFLSQDEYVIRKDMSMLADAGIDVLVLDVTNAVRYWDEWKVLFSTMQKMKAEGNKVPKFCFWTFNGPVVTVVQDLYENIYKQEKYKDLWFYWDGKPLLLYNGTRQDDQGKEPKCPNPHYDKAAETDPTHPHYMDPDYSEKFYTDYTKEVKKFFTLRTMWWGYYKWAGKRFVGTEDNWSYGYNLADNKVKALKSGELLSTHQGKKEQGAVTAAQHAICLAEGNMGVGKSWSREKGEPKLNEQDLPEPTYVPWLGKTVEHPEGYGIYFQERWDEALKTNPEFLYINDWNEWTALIFKPKGTAPWCGRDSPYFFVDQYDAEFNRSIQPMKGGYSDNYYMQMAQNIRKYKGVRPIPELKGFSKIKLDGSFDDWNKVETEYRDTKGDVIHRDHNGYGGLHYTNNSGRNDIVTSKAAVNKQNIYFYAETADKLTSCTDKSWMLLLIDADNNPETGWYGYDFIINKSVRNDNTTTLMRYENSNNSWVEVADLKFNYADNKLEIAVPRKLLKLDKDSFTFDFKWSDNASELKDPISLCTDGDTAPNRRFNYRCIWKQK